MLANIMNYVPQNVEYIIPDNAKCNFPQELSIEGVSPSDMMKVMEEHFSVSFPEHELAYRKLDNYEVEQIREEYCLKQEKEIPVALVELEEAKAKAKQLKQEAEDRLAAINQTIMDLASRVEHCAEEIELPKETIRFALGGYFLFYSHIDGKLVLTKAERINEWEKDDLFTQEEKNKESMTEVFGYETPENID